MLVGLILQPIGIMPLSGLLRTTRSVGIEDIVQTSIPSIPAQMDREEVAFVFR
jgi:Mg/Co/Ni transporter MgtE